VTNTSEAAHCCSVSERAFAFGGAAIVGGPRCSDSGRMSSGRGSALDLQAPDSPAWPRCGGDTTVFAGGVSTRPARRTHPRNPLPHETRELSASRASRLTSWRQHHDPHQVHPVAAHEIVLEGFDGPVVFEIAVPFPVIVEPPIRTRLAGEAKTPTDRLFATRTSARVAPAPACLGS
jgi:hypothetical protein